MNNNIKRFLFCFLFALNLSQSADSLGRCSISCMCNNVLKLLHSEHAPFCTNVNFLQAERNACELMENSIQETINGKDNINFCESNCTEFGSYQDLQTACNGIDNTKPKDIFFSGNIGIKFFFSDGKTVEYGFKENSLVFELFENDLKRKDLKSGLEMFDPMFDFFENELKPGLNNSKNRLVIVGKNDSNSFKSLINNANSQLQSFNENLVPIDFNDCKYIWQVSCEMDYRSKFEGSFESCLVNFRRFKIIKLTIVNTKTAENNKVMPTKCCCSFLIQLQ